MQELRVRSKSCELLPLCINHHELCMETLPSRVPRVATIGCFSMNRYTCTASSYPIRVASSCILAMAYRLPEWWDWSWSGEEWGDTAGSCDNAGPRHKPLYNTLWPRHQPHDHLTQRPKDHLVFSEWSYATNLCCSRPGECINLIHGHYGSCTTNLILNLPSIWLTCCLATMEPAIGGYMGHGTTLVEVTMHSGDGNLFCRMGPWIRVCLQVQARSRLEAILACCWTSQAHETVLLIMRWPLPLPSSPLSYQPFSWWSVKQDSIAQSQSHTFNFLNRVSQ